MSRDRAAVLIKETLGWSYTRALHFMLRNRTAIRDRSIAEGREFLDVAVDAAEKNDGELRERFK